MADATDLAEAVEVRKYICFLDNERNCYAGQSKIGSGIYTPHTVLARYFADGVGSIEELLEAVMKEEEHIIPAGDTVLQQYLALFTILLTIGQGHHLNRFIERGYTDDRLPFFDKPRHFPKSETGSFFGDFFVAQWRYCPVRFARNPVNLQIEPEQILPLRGREQVARQGDAVMYKVVLHEEYDPFTVKSMPFQIGLGTKEIINHTYIFKEFPKASKAAYDRELTAFLFLQKAGLLLGKTLIGFYGSFVHEDTYTMILEYWDQGTLEDFMNVTTPPTNSEDITRLWEGLLKFHETLHTIHHMKTPYGEDVRRHSLLRGWHQNITPQTIAVVSGQTGTDYDYEFRINDLGIVTNTGSTIYTAPECQAEPAELNWQVVDVWSLGCVYSEFAVWLTLGSTGLEDYRLNRQDERAWSGLEQVAAFHDSQYTLQCVQTWHDQAISGKSIADRITEPILQQVVEDMLCEDGVARPSTRQLKMKIQKILMRARKQHLADLSRYDSVTSSETGFSSLNLSSGSRHSHRASVLSNGSQDSGVGYGVGFPGRMTSSATARTKVLRLDSPASQHLVEADEEVLVSTTFSTLMSPVSPLDVPEQRLSPTPPSMASATFRNSDHSEGPEAVSVEPAERTTEVVKRQAVLASTLINGDDKEIFVSSSPHPVSQPSMDQPSPHEQLQISVINAPVPSIDSPGSPTSLEGLPAYSTFEIRPDQDPEATTLPLNGISARVRPNMSPEGSASSPQGQADRSQAEVGAGNDSEIQQSISVTSRHPIHVHPTNSQKAQIYKPYLSLIDGLIWLNNRKGTASNATLRDESYLSALADRDFVFLIDDSATMRAHREMTSRVVRLSSWLLKKYDKNGMDLYFMQKSGKTHARPGHTSDLQRPILKTLDECMGRSNVSARLAQILQEFRDRNAAGSGAQQSSRSSIGSIGSSSKNIKGTKKIMIYVITDCEWVDSSDKSLEDILTAIAATMKIQGAAENAVGIQFIRTKEKPATIEAMKNLKHGDYAQRITIDSQPLEGNVFRLLLGPISDIWDDDDEAGTKVPASCGRNTMS